MWRNGTLRNLYWLSILLRVRPTKPSISWSNCFFSLISSHLLSPSLCCSSPASLLFQVRQAHFSPRVLALASYAENILTHSQHDSSFPWSLCSNVTFEGGGFLDHPGNRGQRLPLCLRFISLYRSADSLTLCFACLSVYCPSHFTRMLILLCSLLHSKSRTVPGIGAQ